MYFINTASYKRNEVSQRNFIPLYNVFEIIKTK